MAQVSSSDGVASVAPQISAPDDEQRIQASPEEFGSAIGRGIQQVAAGASTAARFFGEVQTSDAINNAMGIGNGLVEKYRTLRGADALNAHEDYNSQIDDAFKQARSGLKLPEQQYQFDQQTRGFRNRYLAGMMTSHADQQAHAFGLETNNATYTNGMAIIAGNPNDDTAFKNGIGLMMQGRIKNAQLNGMSEDANFMENSHRETAIDATEARIKSLLASPNPADLTRAKSILDANRTLLSTSKNYDAFSAKVEDTVDKASATREAQGYLRDMAPPGTGPSPNNLGNVKTRAGITDFQQPATPIDGVILAAQTLRTNYQGLSLAEIGAKWAPPSENDTVSWVRNVSTMSGIPAGQVPNLNDPAQLQSLLKGITAAEKSPADRAAFSPAVLDQGVQAALTGQSPKMVKSAILLDQAQTLAKVDADYADNPKMGRLVRAAVNEQYSIAKMAQQSQQLAAADALNQTVRKIGDQIYADPTKDIEPMFGAHPELTQEQVEHMRALRLHTLDQRLNGAPGNYGPKYSDIQQRIFSSAPDRIVNQEQLLALNANGDINVAGYVEASKILADVNKPGAEADKVLQSNFYASAKKAVTLEMEGYSNAVSPERRELWDKALPVLNQAITQGRLKGLTNQQLMDPTNKDSVWGALKPFLPTPAEKTAAAIHGDAKAAAVDWEKITSYKQARDARKRGDITREQAIELARRNPAWNVKVPEAAPQVPVGP